MDTMTQSLGFSYHGTNALVFLGIAVAVVGAVISTARQWFRLSHVPGPFIASITSLWAYRSISRLRFHQTAEDLQKRYGKIVRITPTDVLISDPDNLWRINSARSSYTRGNWYGSIRFNPYGDSVFSELDTAKHDKRKAKLTFGFSGKGLLDIEGSVDQHIAVLVDVLKNRINEGNGQAIVDMGLLLQYFQVDLITLAGMGKAWGNLSSNKDHFQYLTTADKLFQFVHATSMVPTFRTVLFSPLFLRLFGASTTTGWLGEIKKAVEQRVKGEKEQDVGGDMLEEWLKHDLSPTEAELDLSVQVPAGTETSITTIRGILMYLITSPSIYYKLKKEISDGIEHGHISRPIKNEEARNLPYLQAVLSEGMRMSPPLTAGFPKTVPPGGDVICGKILPAGTEVHTNYIALMKDEEVFGRDAEMFRPERFIDCDEATKARRKKVVDLNFGHGRWLCLGRVLALMELNKIFVECGTLMVVQLLRSFDFQVVNPENPWLRESTLSFYIKDFFVQVKTDSISGRYSENWT
ncbi:hypothetical protein JX265_004594 [Neoarthrinium moseri]|uniref:Cytochrome P450 n=1 Tax=Neoarthrinium moseri TaxID=1658444 RepID=A0A9P9WPV1_9PEZI|nr:hypothetical protein JX265_004594 [Neoarthrinium moseri]